MELKIKRFCTFLAALAMAIALAACTTFQEPLRIGANEWPGYESLYLARSLGYFEKPPIQLVEYTSAEVSRALRSGAIKAAALTLDETLLLVQNNIEPRLILNLLTGNPPPLLETARRLSKTVQEKRPLFKEIDPAPLFSQPLMGE